VLWRRRGRRLRRLQRSRRQNQSRRSCPDGGRWVSLCVGYCSARVGFM
jgi:hypothetical protein